MSSRVDALPRTPARPLPPVGAVCRRFSDRAAASDPGLARLRTASTTVLTLGVSLGVLYGATSWAGQPFTVALLGVVISMIASMTFKDANPRQRTATAAAMLAIAAAAVSLGALLAPHTVAGDIVFVAVMTAATAGRRFGTRATTLGMVGFMTYFFALFLGATVSMLPWLICALAIGAVVSLAMTFALPQRPDRQLHQALRSLGARLRLLLAVISDGLDSGQLDAPARRRVARRMAQVRETTLMVDGQIAGLSATDRSAPLDADAWSLRLFDVELASEHLVYAWARALEDGALTCSAGGRGALREAVGALDARLRHDGRVEDVERAQALARQVQDDAAAHSPCGVLALAVESFGQAVVRTRLPAQDGTGVSPAEAREVTGPGDTPERGQERPTADAVPEDSAGPWHTRLHPSTRQAVQVAVASSLAIVAGELLSPARWYWAVIAAFVIYSGTSSRGETLTKGRQRILGTVAGVAVGTVVASLVGGNVVASISLIFVSLFLGFYLMQVSYLFMVAGTTTMLALLYGLLGEFSVGLLLTRIEETAIGAAIGILTALLVLPTSTRGSVRDGIGDFVSALGELVGGVGGRLAGAPTGDLAGAAPTGASTGESTGASTGESTADPTADLLNRARDLDRRLAALRTSAAPLSSGITGLRRPGSVAQVLNTLLACDHYLRGLSRICEPAPDEATREQLGRATTQVTDNLGALAALIGGSRDRAVHPADDALDAAQRAIDSVPQPSRERRRLTTAVRYLRQIDLASRSLVTSLGTDQSSATQTASQP